MGMDIIVVIYLFPFIWFVFYLHTFDIQCCPLPLHLHLFPLTSFTGVHHLPLYILLLFLTPRLRTSLEPSFVIPSIYIVVYIFVCSVFVVPFQLGVGSPLCIVTPHTHSPHYIHTLHPPVVVVVVVVGNWWVVGRWADAISCPSLHFICSFYCYLLTPRCIPIYYIICEFLPFHFVIYSICYFIPYFVDWPSLFIVDILSFIYYTFIIHTFDPHTICLLLLFVLFPHVQFHSLFIGGDPDIVVSVVLLLLLFICCWLALYLTICPLIYLFPIILQPHSLMVVGIVVFSIYLFIPLFVLVGVVVVVGDLVVVVE